MGKSEILRHPPLHGNGGDGFVFQYLRRRRKPVHALVGRIGPEPLADFRRGLENAAEIDRIARFHYLRLTCCVVVGNTELGDFYLHCKSSLFNLYFTPVWSS